MNVDVLTLLRSRRLGGPGWWCSLLLACGQVAAAPAADTYALSQASSPFPAWLATPHCDDGLPAQALSLSAVVEMAVCRHPHIRVTWEALKAQAAAVGEAHAAALPTVSATTTRLRTRTDYPDANSRTTLTGQAAYVNLNWRVFDFGGQQASQSAANSLLAAAIASHDDALQKTMGEVITAYFEVQNARAGMAATEKNAAVAQELLDSARRRSKSGAAGQNDVLQAQTAYARARLEQSRMAGSLDKAMSVLLHAMGLDPDTPLALAAFPYQMEQASQSQEVLLDASGELKAILQEVEHAHPQINAARAQWEAAKYREGAVRAEGLPSVDVSANYNQNGYPGQGLSNARTRIGSIGFAVNFPLFDGYAHHYKQRRALAETRQRLHELEEIRQNVLTELVKAHADATAALRNLETSRELFAAAQLSLGSSRRRYTLGVADILEVLTAQRALADAELERIHCLGEWSAARLRLMVTTGRLNLGMISLAQP